MKSSKPAKSSLPKTDSSASTGGTLVAMIGQPNNEQSPKDRLDALRDRLGINLDELGIRLRISRSTMYNVRGGRTPLSKRLRQKIEHLEQGKTSYTSSSPTTTRVLPLVLNMSLDGAQFVPDEKGTITVPVSYLSPRANQPENLTLTAPGALQAIDSFSAALRSEKAEELLLLVSHCLTPPHNSLEFLNTLSPSSIGLLLRASLTLILGRNWQATLNSSLQAVQ